MNPLLHQPREPYVTPEGDYVIPPLTDDGLDQATVYPAPIYQGMLAFQRDLPQLLREHPGKWVAYYGDERIALAETPEEMVHQCEQQGYDDYLISCVEPKPPFDYISAV